MIDKKPQSAFILYVNGDSREGHEKMGRELGAMLETKIPEFLVSLGKTVAESGKDFATWNTEDETAIDKVAAQYL